MRNAAFLLSFVAVLASSAEETPEQKKQVEANSGSTLSSASSDNKTSKVDPELRRPEGTDAKNGGADSGGKKSVESSGPDNANTAEARKKTAPRIDPNAVLKVEIKISKSQNRNKDSASPPGDDSSKPETNDKVVGETRDESVKIRDKKGEYAPQSTDNNVEAAPAERDRMLSSISYDNRNSGDGKGLPAKKEDTEAVPHGQEKQAPDKQAASAVSQQPAGKEGLQHLENFEGGLSTLCIVSKNINLIREKIHHTDSAGRIRDVLIFKDKDNSLRDYWGRLRFKETNGTYLDETGFYEGKVVRNLKEVLDSGKLTKNGFYQSKSLPDQEVEKDFQSTKFLLNAISKERGISVNVMANESCDLPLVDKLLFARRYTDRQAPKKATVCICADGLCKKPCKEIKMVETKKLE